MTACGSTPTLEKEPSGIVPKLCDSVSLPITELADLWISSECSDEIGVGIDLETVEQTFSRGPINNV
jgi:hypothetical protein